MSSAGWVADAIHGDYVRFSVDGPRVFACLFDAHTSHEAAAFSAAHCHDIFFSCLIDFETEPGQAIEQTFEELDRQFLNSSLPTEVRNRGQNANSVNEFRRKHSVDAVESSSIWTSQRARDGSEM